MTENILPEDNQKDLEPYNVVDVLIGPILNLANGPTKEQSKAASDAIIEVADYVRKLEASLHTPSVPVSVADALAEALEWIYESFHASTPVQHVARKALANYNKFKQGESQNNHPDKHSIT